MAAFAALRRVRRHAFAARRGLRNGGPSGKIDGGGDMIQMLAAPLRSRAGAVRAVLGPALTGLLASGCEMLSSPATTLAPKSDYGDVSHRIFLQILWWDVGIFLVVAAALIWVVVRFRERDPAAIPVQVRGNAKLELAWTLAPVIVLAMIAFPTVAAVFRTQAAPPVGALKIRVTGHQWWWRFEYPELGIATATELHLPAEGAVSLELASPDVIHSFWIPQLGGKRDALPGQTNRIVLIPRTPGVYYGQCAEFCGASHANMRLLGVVESPGDFEAWVERQKAPAATPPDGSPAAAGLTLFAGQACGGCHAIRGVSGGIAGPDLTHFASRTTIAGGMLPNTPAELARWLTDPPAVKPGAVMPNLKLSEADVQALVAYLGSLQ